jgi:hypothetical protein
MMEEPVGIFHERALSPQKLQRQDQEVEWSREKRLDYASGPAGWVAQRDGTSK